ncbi:NADH-quinone oxidoreductase subunit NuoF [Buchnera aphidicola]|uniref:NADH-quinone oxidoreductase subunit F n=1 Tax=Buchnera aphidicola subsp. Tuberolachnus salignus TaxID=98804 RepID=A0A160SWE5_BUCTT|nr:NADH-quinone oxidoreductase subunit NuoF [Buchnera aphidicola]CUR53092.1 NADH-quinone oxidoreductase subunit F [Buchnera aphidicola (Tuberolachnus salignus)]
MKKIKLTNETHPLTWRLNSKISPIWIKEYIKTNGYLAILKTLKNFQPNEIINLIINSKLKGRGGAGFPTGVKWNLMMNNTKKTRYLICNADEMEPGTYKDRFLLENLPHQLIEGMLIAAYALKASCGYIFLRGEYYVAEKNLKKALKEAKYYGYLGTNILKKNFNFNIFLHTGAGRYICGEETALINSLEGKRANPRFKPPFPAFSGLWGKPTCINNVETLSNIPSIIMNGISWYHNLSNSVDTGTKIIGFSGLVKNAGLWELPLGISAREVLEDYAGGIRSGFFLKAWQPGGAGTSLLTEKHLDVKMDFVSLQKIGSRLGTGLAMAIDNSINIVSLVLNLEIFFSRESCGFCTPCREGLPWTVKILKKLEKKQGNKGDIELLEEICENLGPGKTFCAHAPGAISPLKSAIKYFRSEFEKGIFLSPNSFQNILIDS